MKWWLQAAPWQVCFMSARGSCDKKWTHWGKSADIPKSSSTSASMGNPHTHLSLNHRGSCVLQIRETLHAPTNKQTYSGVWVWPKSCDKVLPQHLHRLLLFNYQLMEMKLPTFLLDAPHLITGRALTWLNSANKTINVSVVSQQTEEGKSGTETTLK